MSGLLPTVVRTVARATPRPVTRFIGANQHRSRLLQRIGRASRTALSVDGTIAAGAGAGLRFNVAGSNAGYALGTTEPEIQDAFVSLLKAGDVVYDVGAAVGFFTVIAAREVGPSGSVVGFDPLPHNVAATRHNLALNGFEHAQCLQVALADRAGHAHFALGDETTQGHLTDVPNREATSSTIDVPVARLDDLVADGTVAAPQVIKIDIEGAEVEALRGAGAVLRDHRPTLLIELHGRSAEVAAVLAEHGYGAQLIGADGPVAEAPWGSHVVARPA